MSFFDEFKRYPIATGCVVVSALCAVLTSFLKPEMRYSIFAWCVVAIVVIIVLAVIRAVIRKIYPQVSMKTLKLIIKLIITPVGIVIVTLAMSFLYTDNLSAALGKVLKEEGTIIAKATEQCILECIREDDEKVIITLVDSEAVRKVVYRDALDQAEDKRYIQFIDGRYQTPTNWIEVPYTLTEDKIGSEEKLRLTLTEDERKLFGGGEKVPLLLAELRQLLPYDQIRQILKEIDTEKSVLITEGERKVIEECFNKHKEKDDLYSLMYLVLSDANVITELKRKEVYDVGYYELREYRKGDRITGDEKIVKLLDSPILIKKTVRHLTPYDKLGIIGCYIDELRFQHQGKEPASKITTLKKYCSVTKCSLWLTSVCQIRACK